MADVLTAPKRVWVPEISADRVRKLADQIRLIKNFDGTLCYIKQPKDLFSPCFLNCERDGEVTGLERVYHRETYHKYGHAPLICLPASFAELVAQIPQSYIDEVVAIEVEIELAQNPEAHADGYHTAIMYLYTKP